MARMCKKCGTLLANGVQTCPECNEAVYSRSTAPAKAPTAAPAPKKKLTISEKKERKATKKAQNRKGNFLLLIVDLVLLLLLLGCAALILDALGMVDIPFFGSTPAT